MKHLLVFGYGYTARRIGTRLLERGWRVSGTRTTAEKAQAMETDGVEALVFDGETPSERVREALETATHVLVSVPPGDEGDPVLECHGPDLERAPSLTWMGYLSTTGVYGDRGGDVVDESSETDPGTDRSRRRLEAEAEWRTLADTSGRTLQIFRLSGIYGPGRSVLDRLREGSARRIVGPGIVFNRIHVDDIAAAVIAGMHRPSEAGVFNVSDDEPAPPADVVEFGANLLGMAPPPEVSVEDASLSEAARSFYSENKRVSNKRLALLDYSLRYPTYREGLRAIIASES